ncbi:hypothetical protein FSP39_022072 [Pinctada imbricata]|uniref:Uncharacterized protein n=1 Tax=Pinctada imbricata TaxID=66713 RepID=A0AA89BZR3_PINIB|nr:hypothetical protein FSP39_022072 [Pinctada imbricata]
MLRIKADLLLQIIFTVENAWTFLTGTATFSHGTKVGTVLDHSIDQASGLASSRLHPGVVYTHNNQGDRSRLFAVATNGTLLATLEIDYAENHDWEDIAQGVCPDRKASSCLYIGDVGDHGGDGSRRYIYVVKEPSEVQNSHITPIRVLHFSWSEQDVETLMVDPSGNVILVSKVDGGNGKVGLIPASAFSTSNTFNITNSTILAIPPTKHSDPLGGDISPDGTEVIIRTHNRVFYWKINDGNYLSGLSTMKGREIPVHDGHHGKAVAWDALGSGYYSFSEGKDEPIYYYRRLS